MSEIRITKALAKLAIARQAASFDEAAMEVYLELLGTAKPALVEAACRAFAIRPRADGETAMPSAGEIRAEVNRLGHHQREAELAQRRSLPESGQVNAFPASVEKLKADVRQRIDEFMARRSM